MMHGIEDELSPEAVLDYQVISVPLEECELHQV